MIVSASIIIFYHSYTNDKFFIFDINKIINSFYIFELERGEAHCCSPSVIVLLHKKH